MFLATTSDGKPALLPDAPLVMEIKDDALVRMGLPGLASFVWRDFRSIRSIGKRARAFSIDTGSWAMVEQALEFES